MPAIGPPVSPSATTTSSTRSGAPPPGSGSRSTSVSWSTRATTTAPADKASRRISATRPCAGHGRRDRARLRGHRDGHRGRRPRLRGRRQHGEPWVVPGRRHHDADHAERGEVRVGPDQRAGGQRARVGQHAADHAHRHPGHIRPVVYRRRCHQLLTRPQHGAAAEHLQLEQAGPGLALAGPGPPADLPAARQLDADDGGAVRGQQHGAGLRADGGHRADKPGAVEHSLLRLYAPVAAGVNGHRFGGPLADSDHARRHDPVAARTGHLQKPAELRILRLAQLLAAELSAQPRHLRLQRHDLRARAARRRAAEEPDHWPAHRGYPAFRAAERRPAELAQAAQRPGGLIAVADRDQHKRSDQQGAENQARPPGVVQSDHLVVPLRLKARSAGQRRRSGTSTWRRVSKSSTHLPVPSATESSGLSATCTGMPVSSRIRSSSPRSRAPPPVSTIPRSMTSPASSGGHLSSVVLTASTIRFSGSSIARRTSSAEISVVFGSPLTRSLPRISARGSSAEGNAEPIAILISSAVRSPSMSEYSFLPKVMIAWSISSPPMRIDCEVTIPPREITATSVVPPPMSTTMLPVGSLTGSPAPIAAAIGSSMM